MAKSGIGLQAIHHVAIIASDYPKSKHFYVQVLGLEIIAENFRPERNSYKLDMMLPNGAQLELFSFSSPPRRLSKPEACGLRHLAFEVRDIAAAIARLELNGVEVEPVRIDQYTQKRYTFFKDPDDLPLELYEVPL